MIAQLQYRIAREGQATRQTDRQHEMIARPAQSACKCFSDAPAMRMLAPEPFIGVAVIVPASGGAGPHIT